MFIRSYLLIYWTLRRWITFVSEHSSTGSSKPCTLLHSSPWGQLNDRLFVVGFQGKISAQHHTTLCIQFLDWENNDKKINCNWENRFFYNFMGLWGNFTAFSRVKKVGWCDIRRTVKQSLERIHRINDTKVLSIRPRLFSVFVCLIVFGFIYFCTQRLLGNPLLQMVWV